MLNQRRAQKAAAPAAAAPAATTAAPTKKTAAPAKKATKKAAAEGSLRSIAIGRAYREYEAVVDEDGKIVHRHYFDPQQHASKEIDASVGKDRVVNYSTLFAHINKTVIEPIFGTPFRAKILRMILEGYSDQLLVLAEQGWKVKAPNLVTLSRVTRKARKARNPRTNVSVDVPERFALRAQPMRSAKFYMAQSNG